MRTHGTVSAHSFLPVMRLRLRNQLLEDVGEEKEEKSHGCSLIEIDNLH